MKLYASEDEVYQIRIGDEIVAAYPEIYKPWVIEDIKQNLKQHADIRPDIAGGRRLEDIFAVATYDYWQYGIGTAEEFFCELIGATDEKYAIKYFYPIVPEMECYQAMFQGIEMPVAKLASETVLALPMYADLTVEDVDRICDIILK